MEYKNKLIETASKMVAKGKGILAADESTGTMTKRLNSVGIESTEENRRKYREMLFTTEGMEKFISGVILFDETMRQKSETGLFFPKLLLKKGVIPGIKVDKGAKDLFGFPGEKTTEGLDGLRERFVEYAEMGAGFSKWRSVIVIGDGIPTEQSIDANVDGLVRFAALSQEAGIVPIVEPEVLIDGDHTIERCKEVTGSALKKLFTELKRYRLIMEGLILKPNMVLPGKDCKEQVSIEEVAKATVECFMENVPIEVPGCVFLSGGLSPDEACERLNAINKIDNLPWELSFSFGRALQAEALQAWSQNGQNREKTQKVFISRAEKTSKARNGVM